MAEELDQLRIEVAEWRRKFGRASFERNEAQADNERLRKVLEWYADPRHFTDDGRRAREALVARRESGPLEEVKQ